MTPDEQQRAIEKVCGWTPVQCRNCKPNKCTCDTDKPNPNTPPNYLGDLNACHEMEKVLTYEQKEQYVFWLNHIHPSADIHHSDAPKDFRLEVFSLVHAPASQRREAFLRTLNLWTETPTQPQ